jgi:O-antigen/teichoic acid export membrane protein
MGWLAGNTYISYAVSLVTFMVVARALGADGYGSVSLALAYIGMLSFLYLPGFDKVLIRAIAAAADSWELLFRRLIGLNLLAASLSVGLAILGLAFYELESTATGTLLMLLPMLVTQPLASLMSAMCQGQQKMKWVALVGATRQLAYSAIVAGLVFSVPYEWRARTVAACISASYLVAMCAFTWLVRNRLSCSIAPMWPRFRWPTWRAGLTLTSFAVLIYLIGKVDVLILGAYVPAASIGVYAVALNIAQRPQGLVNALATVVLPLAAEQVRAGAKITVRQLTQVSLATGMAAAGIGTAVWFLSRLLLPGVFGAEFAAALVPLGPLLIAFAVSAAVQPTTSMLQAVGGEGLVALALAVRAVFNVSLDIVLLEMSYGILAVAWVSALGAAIYAVLVLLVGWPRLVATKPGHAAQGGDW